VDFFLHAHLIYKARCKAGDSQGQISAPNFKKWGAKERTSNLPPQPVITLDNSPYQSPGYWKHVENIQKEYLERDRVVPYVIDNIIVRMNTEGYSFGDGGRESSDTEDRSDCSSSEDMN